MRSNASSDLRSLHPGLRKVAGQQHNDTVSSQAAGQPVAAAPAIKKRRGRPPKTAAGQADTRPVVHTHTDNASSKPVDSDASADQTAFQKDSTAAEAVEAQPGGSAIRYEQAASVDQQGSSRVLKRLQKGSTAWAKRQKARQDPGRSVQVPTCLSSSSNQHCMVILHMLVLSCWQGARSLLHS